LQKKSVNSLLVVRDVAQNTSTADEARQKVVGSERGLTWIYPIVDATGKAYILEAGKTVDDAKGFPLFDYVTWRYRCALRRAKGALAESGRKVQRGVFARDTEYEDSASTARLNRRLWRIYNWDPIVKVVNVASAGFAALGFLFKLNVKGFAASIKTLCNALFRYAPYNPKFFSPTGVINCTWNDRNCPGPFYFAPLRKLPARTLVATNFSLSPALRLTAMNEWIALIGRTFLNDFQWRYDTLARLLRRAFSNGQKGLSKQAAWDLIDFLTPDPNRGHFRTYHNEDGVTDWRRLQVKGSVSLFHPSTRWMKSQFGHYGDQPVEIHLPNYL